jgi:segregation and condensation protein A
LNTDNPNQSLSEPPLNLLFNTSLLGKQNVWDIDISNLLQLLLDLINSSGKKDLRICGIAIWSSSLIYRLKVESIFKLEKIAMERKTPEMIEEKEIPNITPINFPFRLTSTSPVSLEELLQVLQNMITDLSNPNSKSRTQIKLEPIKDFDFDQYFVRFEKILVEHEEYILRSLEINEIIIFGDFVKRMQSIEVVRFFICLLHLAMKNKIELIQSDDSYDIEIRKIN